MDAKFQISQNYYPSFARVFSPIVIDSLICTGKSKYLSEVLQNSGVLCKIDTNIRLNEFFEWLYGIISHSYRSEYVYKNAIANKILLGRHSLNTAHMLTEFRVGNCKADVVILNGTSTVYEIKSEYDSLDRIQNQVASYRAMFDQVNVITAHSQLAKLETVIPFEVGLLELTNKNTIRVVREAVSAKGSVEPEIIFNSLRKYEYTCIIKRAFGYVPDVPNTHIYRECKRLFCSLQPEIAHDEMVKALYQRGNRTALKEFIHNVPASLKAYAISTDVSPDKATRLNTILGNKLKTALVTA